jgi:hypothetical protein
MLLGRNFIRVDFCRALLKVAYQVFERQLRTRCRWECLCMWQLRWSFGRVYCRILRHRFLRHGRSTARSFIHSLCLSCFRLISILNWELLSKLKGSEFRFSLRRCGDGRLVCRNIRACFGERDSILGPVPLTWPWLFVASETDAHSNGTTLTFRL